MSDILEKFNIFSKISEEFKQNIQLFHIFDDEKGKNAFIITNDDKVFAFGSNSHGVCGFGHNETVDTPKEIPELCGKQIKQLFVGSNYLLAINQNKHVFGWGKNWWGQLARGYTSKVDDCLKPEKIPNLENIIEICCGSGHSLALDDMGNIFSWGYNKYGQVGCGQELGKIINSAVQLKPLPRIKSIKCFESRSYFVTSNGLLYSWGYNGTYCLGHELSDSIPKPKLIIGLNNVLSVDCSVDNTYFLLKDCDIYICGKIYPGQNQYQKRPIIFETDLKFQSLKSVQKFAITLSEETVYCLESNVIKKTNYKTIFDFILNEKQITFKTICLSFDERYELQSVLGSGGFGKVLKVKEINLNTIFALKKIEMNENSEYSHFKIEAQNLAKEVDLMKKCNDDYVVKYFGHYFESDCLYILMELMDENLENIIKNKIRYFERKPTDSMTLTEYFISSQLLKELLECVQYLHQLNPPIIHRDLKPQNILVNHKPRNGRFLKICDFGLATYGSDKTITHTQGIGSFQYMAPEVTEGLRGETDLRVRYSTKADIYSLGKIICDLFGFSIYSSNDIISNNKNLKQHWIFLEKLIKCATDPQYRLRPTCAQILEKSDMWLIKIDKLNIDKKPVEKYQNQFIKSYLTFKLNENNNSNTYPNWMLLFNPFS